MKYVEGVMNYTGSKFKLLSQILPELDYTKPYFVDIFAGGGSVYINVVDKYKKIIVNDIISDIINIHKELIESDEIIGKTKLLCPGKENPEGFSKLRTDYNNNPSPEALWALILSSTNNMIRFNQKFKYNQTYGKRGWNNNTQKKVDAFTNHIRPYKNNIKFVSKSFDMIDISSDKIMFYCDPPYSNTNAGYNAYWKKDDDQKLYEYVKNIDKIGSSFMVSGVLEHAGKPCYLLDKLISDGYKVIELDFNYNKVSKSGNKETKEIVIVNY